MTLVASGRLLQAEFPEMGGAGPEALAEIRVLKPVSIIIPTYKEAPNILPILTRIESLKLNADLELEVLFVDDDSRDGIVERVEGSGSKWARVIVRKHGRGLSPAVLEGMRQARYPVLVCMDCDLSHPPERIPDMVLALSAGAQMVLGSRYVAGGTTDHDWGYLRYLTSAVATLLARPLTSAHDPMSGFFALRKADFEKARDLNPVGYKIGLELIVKCGFDNVAEVPIHFSDRLYGESKLTIAEQLKYLQHLRRLYLYKFANAMYFIQFLAVGFIGTVVNISVLSVLRAAGMSVALALAVGIAVSVVSNFFLNRRFTFSYARTGNLFAQFTGFVAASALGIGVNFLVSVLLASGPLRDAIVGVQLAAVCGIASGMIFNFVASRFVVFRKRHVVKEPR